MAIVAEIPAGEALELCRAIYAENRGKWYTFNGLWCTFCGRFSTTETVRCYANAPGNRGCSQVVRRWEAERRKTQ